MGNRETRKTTPTPPPPPILGAPAEQKPSPKQHFDWRVSLSETSATIATVLEGTRGGGQWEQRRDWRRDWRRPPVAHFFFTLIPVNPIALNSMGRLLEWLRERERERERENNGGKRCWQIIRWTGTGNIKYLGPYEPARKLLVMAKTNWPPDHKYKGVMILYPANYINLQFYKKQWKQEIVQLKIWWV